MGNDVDDDGDGATGNDNDDNGDSAMDVTMMATARRDATTRTMVTDVDGRQSRLLFLEAQ